LHISLFIYSGFLTFHKIIVHVNVNVWSKHVLTS
jgi:hypothetical protein